MTPGKPMWRRPAYTWDIPVLVLLAVSWMTIPVFLAHIVTSLLLVFWVVMHLITRRSGFLRVTGTGMSSRTRVWRSAHLVLILIALAMTVSGVLRWIGVPREYAGHAIASYTLAIFALVHLWFVRHRLRARLSSGRAEKS